LAFPRHGIHIVATLRADADARYVKLLVGSEGLHAGQNAPGQDVK
jgi:hypothetical protein